MVAIVRPITKALNDGRILPAVTDCVDAASVGSGTDPLHLCIRLRLPQEIRIAVGLVERREAFRRFGLRDTTRKALAGGIEVAGSILMKSFVGHFSDTQGATF